jgi:hypothetical protein
LLLFPDLSPHAVIDVVPVIVVASAASSHSEHPVIDVGLNADGYGSAVIAAFDILTVSVCLKDA